MGRALDSLRTLGSHDMLDDGNTTYTLHALRPAPSAPALSAYSNVPSSASTLSTTVVAGAGAGAAAAAAGQSGGVESWRVGGAPISSATRNHTNHTSGATSMFFSGQSSSSDPLAGTGPPPQSTPTISIYSARGSNVGGGSNSSNNAIGVGSFPLTPSALAPPLSSTLSTSGYEVQSQSQGDALARNLRVQLSICIAERDAARGEVNALRERLAAAEERIATIASHFQVLGNIANAAHTAALSGDAASLHNIRAAAMAPGIDMWGGK